jgi:hypothetical protein
MCGALDCKACHPENFRKIGNRFVYIDEVDPDPEDLQDDSPIDDE